MRIPQLSPPSLRVFDTASGERRNGEEVSFSVRAECGMEAEAMTSLLHLKIVLLGDREGGAFMRDAQK